MRRKVGCAILVGLVLFSSVASAGYIPHWQNPVEVSEYGEKSVTLVVISPFSDAYDHVTIEVTGHLKRHVNVSDTNFTLTQSGGGKSNKRVTIEVSSGNHSSGDTFDGDIIIHHRGSEQKDGETKVDVKDTVHMDVEVVQNDGLMSIPGFGGVSVGVLIFGLVNLCAVGAAGWYAYKEYEGDDDDLVEWKEEI